MPEYLAPGVFIEETSFRSKSIEGVGTTTTGFVGATRTGPIDLEPDVLTSLADFERVYGNGEPLLFTGGEERPNYIWHAVRAFFENGGRRLYVARVYHTNGGDNGQARGELGGAGELTVAARFPGLAGNYRVRIAIRHGQNALATRQGQLFASGVRDRDVVSIVAGAAAPVLAVAGSDANGRFFTATAGTVFRLAGAAGVTVLAAGDSVRIVTLVASVLPAGSAAPLEVWGPLAPDPAHLTNGARDSLTATFAAEPSSLAQQRTLPIVVTTTLASGAELVDLLRSPAADPNLAARNGRFLPNANFPREAEEGALELDLVGGNDGTPPDGVDFEGQVDPFTNRKRGLKSFEDVEDIAIVAAPGATHDYANHVATSNATILAVIGHAERMRYRVAILDAGQNQSIAEVRALRAQFDSKHAALYFPWVRILDPFTRREIHQPPSGFVAGIWARNDIQRAVWKAPANEVVQLALGFETLINQAQQEVLNPEGINCFRFFEGRGYRLWGARTISSDPEWKYVNVRRYFAYLERSIDRGTQWAVFEPNGEALWANVKRTIEDFLLNEWMQGALLGEKPERAYFVRCDRSTMSQNDLDNGRLVCLIGVAPLKPAEFVIFRIGQWTADAKKS